VFTLLYRKGIVFDIFKLVFTSVFVGCLTPPFISFFFISFNMVDGFDGTSDEHMLTIMFLMGLTYGATDSMWPVIRWECTQNLGFRSI
jgi:hypothetical protein